MIPVIMIILQLAGFAPFILRIKVKTAVDQEVCVVIDGPEYHKDCWTSDKYTRIRDFTLYHAGTYQVFAMTKDYRTTESTVEVH